MCRKQRRQCFKVDNISALGKLTYVDMKLTEICDKTTKNGT